MPFLEELAFRRGLQRQMLGQDPSQLRRRIAYVGVAVLFAMAHLFNHAADLRAAASEQKGASASVALAVCLHQLSFTFLASLLIYSPVFTEFGFRAAVGAHACWNLTAELCPCVSYLPMKCGIQLLPFWSLLTCSTVSGCMVRLCTGPWLRRRCKRVQEQGFDLLMGSQKSPGLPFRRSCRVLGMALFIAIPVVLEWALVV